MKTIESTVDTAIASTEAIRPFSFRAKQVELDDLKRRILATKFPDKEIVTDLSQGVELATMQKLARYWGNDYDFSKLEAKLNAYPQFITGIDGVDIHFIHVRSKEPDARPLILAHGWPGSPIELMKTIAPLTNPIAYGGKREDAFDVVIPSMPGYGFSGKPATIGWGPERIAAAYIELMNRLGYKEFFAQGGDWGALVVDLMAVQSPDKLLGIHTNMPGAVPPEVDQAAYTGAPAPSGLQDDEQYAYERLKLFYSKGLSYALQMANHPQTLYALGDSPVGLAAWLLDHDILSYKLIAGIFNGEAEGLTMEDILDNISLYWLTNTAVSSSRLYWENKLGFFSAKQVSVPVAVSVFPDEIYIVSERWAEKAYPDLVFYKKHNKGGHFAAWEQPGFLVEDIREGFRSLR